MPCAAGLLRQKIARKLGTEEHTCCSIAWWCILPCFPLLQETKMLKTIDDLVPPEFNEIEGSARK